MVCARAIRKRHFLTCDKNALQGLDAIGCHSAGKACFPAQFGRQIAERLVRPDPAGKVMLRRGLDASHIAECLGDFEAGLIEDETAKD